ncbi:hypothetical protein FHL15_007620 [Xylaria flabelliformis]|uniref:Uncharacterized protein n=1 Tax=Xylaria flabelliformis TaxID=2512241 RepID=A0A553HTX0_9PEZI|nr:hypothetical protein FHL15_007620 [Xylaria flabelliformis]
MFSQIVTFSGLLAATWFTSSAEAQKLSPVRLSSRANDYTWTITWTGPTYEVSAPTHDAAGGSVPLIDATCQGTVDQPLQSCSLLSTTASPITVVGNFSTYETSGVGNGLIDIKATWFDQASTLTGVTPLQATTANHNTWTVDPEGCPVTDCAATGATRAVRRGSLGLQI